MKNDFKDQGPVMLKNIQHPVHVQLQISIKHQVQCHTDDDPKSKLVLVPIKVEPLLVLYNQHVTG